MKIKVRDVELMLDELVAEEYQTDLEETILVDEDDTAWSHWMSDLKGQSK